MIDGWIQMSGKKIESGVLLESGQEDPRTTGPSKPKITRKQPVRKSLSPEIKLTLSVVDSGDLNLFAELRLHFSQA